MNFENCAHNPAGTGNRKRLADLPAGRDLVREDRQLEGDRRPPTTAPGPLPDLTRPR
jgi:hypothetical protein